MTRKPAILFIAAVFSTAIYGQDSPAYKSKWQTRVLAGVNIPLTKLLQGAETDCLFQYGDHSVYLQMLSISYFFHKHWGWEMNFQAATSSKIGSRGDDFDAFMQSQYGDRHYVSPYSGAVYNNTSLFGGDIERLYFGAVYRFETDKFYVYPKLAIGVTSFNTDWGRADLKEKNSNVEYRVSYSCGEMIMKDFFTLAPSVSFGYKFSKRFYLNADVVFSYYKPNIAYEKTTINLYTREKTVELFDYKKGISTLSLGAGLIFVIR